MFQYVRLYSDENGDSQFEEKSISLEDAGSIGLLSARIPVSSLIFREVAPDYDYDFHNAPQRQFLVLLDGEIEIETSRGEKKSFRPGEVILLEDTTGKGHRTRNLKLEKRRSLFIEL